LYSGRLIAGKIASMPPFSQTAYLLAALCFFWGCSNSGGIPGKSTDSSLQEINFPTPIPSPKEVSSPTVGAVTENPTPTDTPEPLEYVVEETHGTVLLVQNGKPEPVTLEEEETVEQGDEIITKENSKAILSLDENTLIHLGPNSDLHITDLGPNETNGFISRVELVGGNILSEVEKLSDSQSTFEVTSGGVVCGVRGTSFEVQKQGQEVQTNTFRGVVEMKKDRYVQKITANEHLSFSFRRKSFLGKRRINEQERGRFQNWNVQLGGLKKKARERKSLMESVKRLPPAEKSKILEQMRQAPPRQRFQALRRAVKKENVSSPQRPGENISSARPQDQVRPGQAGKANQKEKPNLKIRKPQNRANPRSFGQNGNKIQNRLKPDPRNINKPSAQPRVSSKPQNPVSRTKPSNGPKHIAPRREFQVPRPQNKKLQTQNRQAKKPKEIDKDKKRENQK
jgi:hypothetical protein